MPTDRQTAAADAARRALIDRLVRAGDLELVQIDDVELVTLTEQGRILLNTLRTTRPGHDRDVERVQMDREGVTLVRLTDQGRARITGLRRAAAAADPALWTGGRCAHCDEHPRPYPVFMHSDFVHDGAGARTMIRFPFTEAEQRERLALQANALEGEAFRRHPAVVAYSAYIASRGRRRQDDQRREPFICPRCAAVSWHPQDLEYGYCGACHDFTGGQA